MHKLAALDRQPTQARVTSSAACLTQIVLEQVAFPSQLRSSSTFYVVTAASRLAAGSGSRRLASAGELMLPYNAWLSCVSNHPSTQRPAVQASAMPV